MMETQKMKMDAITIVLLLNTLMFVLEALKQTRIYALGVNRVSIKTTQLIQSSEYQDAEMDTECMMKSVMMVTTMMEMGDHRIAILKKVGIELVETAHSKTIVMNVEQGMK